MKFIYSKTFIIIFILVAATLVFSVTVFGPAQFYQTQNQILGLAFSNPLGPSAKVETQNKPPKAIGKPVLETVTAKSFLVYDVNSKVVLVQKNIDQPLSVASLTKLLTGFVVYNENSSFKTTTTITDDDVFDVDPILGLKPSDEVELGDLFYSMLVGSANDAALALSNFTEKQSGQSFVKLMNDTATKLGMKNSHFSNPLGFDSESNYSTAEDMKILVEAVRQNQAFNLVGKNESYNFVSKLGNNYEIKATNKLLHENKELYAIKTGYTNLANGAMITEYKEGVINFVVIVLSSDNRESDTLTLVSEIKKNYIW